MKPEPERVESSRPLRRLPHACPAPDGWVGALHRPILMFFSIRVVTHARHTNTKSLHKCPPNLHWVPGLVSVEQIIWEVMRG